MYITINEFRNLLESVEKLRYKYDINKNNKDYLFVREWLFIRSFRKAGRNEAIQAYWQGRLYI